MRKTEFQNFGESKDRKGRVTPSVDTSINVIENEDENRVNKNDPLRRKKFKTGNDVVAEKHHEIVASTDPDDYQEVDDQADKIEALRNSILNKKTKAHVEHFNHGNVASVGLAEDTGEKYEYPTEQVADSTLETNPEEWKHLSLKRKVQTQDATQNEILVHQGKTLGRDVLNSRDRFGKNSYDPGDNLKTMNPKKKERSLRGLLRQILGKDKSPKTEYIAKEDDFFDQNFAELDEDHEHPMSKHWKDEE